MLARIAKLGLVPVALAALSLGAPLSQGVQTKEPVPPLVLKAHFLPRFATYVTWPESAFRAEEPRFVIAVLGEDPFGRLLELVVRERQSPKRPFELRRFPLEEGELPSKEALSEVNVLFVSASEKDRLPQIFERLEGTSVLTVSDLENFAESGGMVELVLIDPHIKLRFNPSAAAAAGLEARTKLLILSTIVGPKR